MTTTGNMSFNGDITLTGDATFTTGGTFNMNTLSTEIRDDIAGGSNRNLIIANTGIAGLNAVGDGVGGYLPTCESKCTRSS